MILVDQIRELPSNAPAFIKKWKVFCHLMSDESVEELHEFAQKIGLKRE